MTKDLRPYFTPEDDTQYFTTVVVGYDVLITARGDSVNSHIYKFFTPNIIARSDIQVSDVTTPPGTTVGFVGVSSATGQGELLGWQFRINYSPSSTEGASTCKLRIRGEVYNVTRVFERTV